MTPLIRETVKWSAAVGMDPVELQWFDISGLTTARFETTTDVLMDAIAQDKKVVRGALTFILTHGIGQAFIEKNVQPDVAVAVRERFPDTWSPGRSDLCFATTNRQGALAEIAPRCDAVGWRGSSLGSLRTLLLLSARGR